MAQDFQGDAAYLNDTDFGTMLLEIGRLKVSNESKDPQEAFIARVNLFADLLDEEKRKKEQHLPEDLKSVKTAGLLRDILGIRHARNWLARVPRILRGIGHFESDHPRQVEEPGRLAA